jgi:hypothetical protein
MNELGWTLLAVFVWLVFLLIMARYHRYCCLQDRRGLDDSDEEKD